MPRHRRQRPAWLPTWIPFKDGRYLGLARQTILAWSSTILATMFFLLTVAYATEKSRISSAKLVHSSRSNTILVLRVLSEVAGVFLASSIYSTFEVVQWVLVSRDEGIRLPQFLALQSSTGTLGLLAIAIGRSLPTGKWPMKSRLMSVLRLIAQAIVPLTGVLIMSKVDSNPQYIPLPNTITPIGFGMESFNGSAASTLGVWQDVMFNAAYVAFLSNPTHTIDVTSDAERRVRDCARGIGLTVNASCSRTILMTQEYQNVDASIANLGGLDDQVVLSFNQRIYSLEYRDNIDIARTDLRCQGFSAGPASYRICVQNSPDDTIEALIVPCPASLIAKKECAKDTSWHEHRGFTTSLRPSFLNASVSYERTSSRIIAHELQSPPEPTYVDAEELLSALTVILDTSLVLPNSSISNSILGAPNHFFGRLIAGHFYRISKLMETSPEAIVKGTNALQSILAMTLFYCQNGVLGQGLLTIMAPNSSAASTTHRNGAFSRLDNNTYVALADTQYRIQVGRATLIAYTVLGGVTLLTCIVVLFIGSLLELLRMDAESTLWPTLDFYTQCKVQDKNGKVLSAHKRVELAWIHDRKEMFEQIEGLSVTRRKRGHGPDLSLEPGEQLVRMERAEDE